MSVQINISLVHGTIFRKFSKIFKMLSEGPTNVSEQFTNFSRRLQRKSRRCFDLILINFDSLSIETWQNAASRLVKNDITHVWISFFSTRVIPILSICYHSLCHCILYNKLIYLFSKYVTNLLKNSLIIHIEDTKEINV